MRVIEHSEVERLYREHRERLWRAVFLFAGDRDVATDAVAEAFAQALRRGPAIRSILPWVWTATFRIAAGELKRRGMAAPVTEGASYELPLETVSLIEGLGRLPARQREAIVLRFYGDRSLREIASIMGSSVPAVGMLLSRGRRQLRGLLEVDDG
jgi:DNA-directed RNA polymerase specialized sigma24 family protein